MPTYDYACDKEPKEHPIKEVVHKMADDPEVTCDTCGAKMHKKPSKGVRFYMSPFDILADWSTENHYRHKARARGHKVERFSPGKVNAPGAGVPQKQFEHRRYKKDGE